MLIAVVVVVTKDGMALLALLFLQSPSYEQYQQAEELEPACGPLGFIDHNALAEENDEDEDARRDKRTKKQLSSKK